MSAANMNSNRIIEEVTNEILLDLINRPDFMEAMLFDDSNLNLSNNFEYVPLPTCSSPQQENHHNINDTTTTNNVITLDETYIHQLIDLELRNVPSSLGLVWSKLSANNNEFQFKIRSNSSSPTTSSTSSSNHQVIDNNNNNINNMLFNSFSLMNENQDLSNSNRWEPSSTPVTTSDILPSLENSQAFCITNNMSIANGPLSCAGSPNKITKKHKMKSTPMKKQLVENELQSSYCLSFHQPESSFTNFTSFDDKKVSKKRKSSSNNNMPNYRVRFSHNKFEEIEFKKSNPKGKFIIFK